MSIIAFWNDGMIETGKTLSMVAISTLLGIEHNKRILVISTGLNDETLNHCYWEERKVKKNLGLFGPNTNTALQEGITGLAKIMKTNKVTPENITNYTRIILKDNRLEILKGYKGTEKEYKEIKELYPDLINIANTYYDYVFVDINEELGEDLKRKILEDANIVVASISQRLSSINRFMEIRENEPIFQSKKAVLLIGKYDRYSKYTIKNITRYMGEKNKVSTIPFNTLFFEACEEATVVDFFFKLRKLDTEDRNGFFISEIRRACDNIIYRIEDLKYKV